MTYEYSGVADGRMRGIRAWYGTSRMLWRIAEAAAVLTLSLSLAVCGSEAGSQEQEPQDPLQPASPVTPSAPTTAQAQQPTSPAGDQRPTGHTGTTQSQQPAPADTSGGRVDATGKRRRVMPVDLVRFVPEGVCTKRQCPPEKPCCNTCRFARWRPQVGKPYRLKGSTTATADIPTCKMNGCGRCAFHLLANGMISGDTFKAFDIRKVKPAGVKRTEPAR